MKFLKNCILAFMIVGTVGLGCSMEAKASDDCGDGCGTTIVCGAGAPMIVDSHTVMLDNGRPVTCYIRRMRTSHTLQCIECGHVFENLGMRTCFTIHERQECAHLNKYNECGGQ